MLRQNSSLIPVHPMGVQLISRKNLINKGNAGQLGFFPGFDKVLAIGKQVIGGLIKSASSGNKNSHIDAQNQANSIMESIVKAYQQLKAQGLLTRDHIEQAQAGIREVVETFKDFADRVGTQRSLQGYRDVETLGDKVIRDMEADKVSVGITPTIPSYPRVGSGLPVPTTDGGGGGVADIPSILPTLSAYLPFILAGAFLFMLPKIGKRERD